jgi:hypothetical protein
VRHQKLNDTPEVSGAKRVHRGGDRCSTLALLRLLVLVDPLLSAMCLDDAARGDEHRKVPPEHIPGRLPERVGGDTNVAIT